MLKAASRFRFCVAQRNFFPLPPLYPENEELTYRPKITNVNEQYMKLHNVYKKKMRGIVGRVKERVRDIRESQRPEEVVKEEPKQAIIKKVLKNVYIDEETNIPFGLFFDDFIHDIKVSRGQKYEAEYNKKVEGLLKAMRAMSEAELLATSRDMLIKFEAPEHVSRARKLIFDRLRDSLENMSEEDKKKIMGDVPHESPISDEALLDKIVTPTQLDILTHQLAKDKLKADIANFTELEAKYNEKIRPKHPMDKFVQDLGFYESPVTDPEFSEDERLLGMRWERDSNGQEALQTEESIKNKVNLDFVKRVYLKRIAAKSRLGIDEPVDEDKDQNVEEQERVKDYFIDLEKSSSFLQLKAKSINKQIEPETKFEDIVKSLDFLLLGAPQFIKDLYNDPKNRLKGYESHFQDIEKKQSLLWKDFEITFKTIFPERETVSEYKTVTQEDLQKREHNKNISPLISDKTQQFDVIENSNDHTFSIELYKELNQPSNLQFFHHYLTNIFRVNRDAINDGLQTFHHDLNPYTYDIPQTAMVANENEGDSDIEAEEHFEQIKIEKFEEQDAVQLETKVEAEYEEASLLTYIGKGKRKSSKCMVQIKKGTGDVIINGKNVINYFTHPFYRRTALRVIELGFLSCLIDVEIVVRGGSQSAQAQCICSGLSRAIVKMCPSLKNVFRKLELTTTDARKVERKKVGLYKARKKYPYSRR